MICANQFCERESAKRYKTVSGSWVNLCSICSDAFRLGQANPNSSLDTIPQVELHKFYHISPTKTGKPWIEWATLASGIAVNLKTIEGLDGFGFTGSDKDNEIVFDFDEPEESAQKLLSGLREYDPASNFIMSVEEEEL